MLKDNFQNDIVKILLNDSIDKYGFVLAGGNALVEAGMSDRKSQDIDLFTQNFDIDNFSKAIEAATKVLSDNGYDVTIERLGDTFAKAKIKKNDNSTEVDFGFDYREFDAKRTDIGVVLDERDAILNKMSAVYTRGLPRDFIDFIDKITTEEFPNYSNREIVQIVENLLSLGYIDGLLTMTGVVDVRLTVKGSEFIGESE